ncbi:MAG: hypothetical protein L3J11_06300 [Draconibacterium sp.]|nr:hypothetical protein [Draconibacterium sp.]
MLWHFLLRLKNKDLIISMPDKKPIALYFFCLASSGGAERMIIRLSNELDSRGYDVHLISWDKNDAKSFYPINEKVKWHKFGFNNGIKDKMRRTFSLYKLLRKIKPLCFLGFVMSADKVIYTANILARIPMIACERNSPKMYSIKFGCNCHR